MMRQRISTARHRNTLSACVALAAASLAMGQQPIYSNASPTPSVPALNASTASASGVPAPLGALWSEVSSLSAAESNALAGVSGQMSGTPGAFRFADDFTVGANRTWQIQSISFYAYQPGWAGALSPFGAVNVQIWNGRPGDAGSTVIWGDPITNRLAMAANSNVYRIFNTLVGPPTAPDTTRVLWQLDATIGTTLPPGTYWLDWQVASVDPLGVAFSPTATVPGVRTQSGWNAVQFKPSSLATAASWTPILDPGKPSSASDVPQALPFIVRGLVGGCPADFNGANGLNVQDIFDFLNAWFVTDPRADFNGDGHVTVQDIFDFLAAWFAGCP